MNPHQFQEFSQSPKDEIDYSKMTEAQRQADFRLKKQEYLRQKMMRKKQIMKDKRKKFGSSSSQSSNDSGPQTPSSKSTAKKIQDKAQNKNLLQDTLRKIQTQKKSQKQVTPSRKKQESSERISITIFSKKTNQQTKQILVIQNKFITIQNKTQQIRKFTKIKIISETTLECPYKIKINLQGDQEMIFSPLSNQNIQGIPSSYYVFAKLIELKLLQNSKLIDRNQQKIAGIPQKLVANSLIYGNIYKKSQVLGNWQQRLVVINKQGIFSYKSVNKKHSIFIPIGTISQLWTRFQIQNNFLVVKIWHNSSKTQFGFPMYKLVSVNSWLFNFYLMMKVK